MAHPLPLLTPDWPEPEAAAPTLWVDGVDFALCRRCGRPLLTALSVEAGIGARCAQEEFAESTRAQKALDAWRRRKDKQA